MAMHQGMDLSRFKKISSDGKTSTLRHSQGHEVKIAHTGLSPKMREHLNSMPLHLAKSGDVQQDDMTSMPPEPMPTDPQSAAIPPKPEPTANAVSPDNTVVVTGQRPPKTVAQRAQEMTDHDLAFQQDLAKGHIAPPTYQKLFEKEETLGKLGTLFGLLIGGAGAGLTHQPNAVLGMMDNELAKDLEAQKSSNENAQNWYRLNQAHELQKHQQEQMDAQTEGIHTANYGSFLDAEKKRASLTQLAKDIPGLDMSAANATYNQMRLVAVQKFQNEIDKMAPGPNRDAAQQTLDSQIKPAVAAGVIQDNNKTAAKKELVGTLKSNENKSASGPVNYGKLQQLAKKGRVFSRNDIAPDMTEEEYNKAKDEGSQAESIDNAAREYHEAFNTLNKRLLGGSLNEQDYNALTTKVNAKIARFIVGHYNGSEAEAQKFSSFPSWKDLGGKGGAARRDKYESTMKALEDKYSEVTPTLRSHPGTLRPWQKFESPFEAKQDSAIEKYAKDNKLDYKTAAGILQKRGYKPK